MPFLYSTTFQPPSGKQAAAPAPPPPETLASKRSPRHEPPQPCGLAVELPAGPAAAVSAVLKQARGERANVPRSAETPQPSPSGLCHDCAFTAARCNDRQGSEVRGSREESGRGVCLRGKILAVADAEDSGEEGSGLESLCLVIKSSKDFLGGRASEKVGEELRLNLEVIDLPLGVMVGSQVVIHSLALKSEGSGQGGWSASRGPGFYMLLDGSIPPRPTDEEGQSDVSCGKTLREGDCCDDDDALRIAQSDTIPSVSDAMQTARAAGGSARRTLAHDTGKGEGEGEGRPRREEEGREASGHLDEAKWVLLRDLSTASVRSPPVREGGGGLLRVRGRVVGVQWLALTWRCQACSSDPDVWSPAAAGVSRLAPHLLPWQGAMCPMCGAQGNGHYAAVADACLSLDDGTAVADCWAKGLPAASLLGLEAPGGGPARSEAVRRVGGGSGSHPPARPGLVGEVLPMARRMRALVRRFGRVTFKAGSGFGAGWEARAGTGRALGKYDRFTVLDFISAACTRGPQVLFCRLLPHGAHHCLPSAGAPHDAAHHLPTSGAPLPNMPVQNAGKDSTSKRRNMRMVRIVLGGRQHETQAPHPVALVLIKIEHIRPIFEASAMIGHLKNMVWDK